MTQTCTTVADLKMRAKAKIIGFAARADHTETRFREIGFAEGDIVEVLHKGLFGGTPLNVRLHGTSIAMRPAEARLIQVELLGGAD